MLWHCCKQTSVHISSRILEHTGDTRLQNQESLIGEHSTKTRSDKITVRIMVSVSSEKPLKYYPNFNHEDGYRGEQGIFSNFLLNHSTHSQYKAPYATLPFLLALQDLQVGLQPADLLFMKVTIVLYNEMQKNITWLI